jgi:predicted deacylase
MKSKMHFLPPFVLCRLFLLLVFSLLVSQVFVSSQSSKKITVGTIVAEPGTKVSGIIKVPQGVDQGTIIPVSVINGSKPGPVLSLIAGQHGTEYVPIITLQRLLSIIDPDEISGAIIMVHIANIPSFKERKIYYSPVDGKNPNRQFPGNKVGTISERIADIITGQVIDQSDYLLDLHGGEMNETILHYVSFEYDCPDKSVCEKTKLLAHSFGGYYIQPEPYNITPDSVKNTYCHLTAIRRGVPAIFVESGGRGETDIESILYIEHGILNVLKALKMTEGEVKESDPVVYLPIEEPVTCHSDGILYSMVECGQTVSKGAFLGYATDYFGNIIEEFHSPVTGIVLMLIDIPVVNKDDVIYFISEPKFTLN